MTGSGYNAVSSARETPETSVPQASTSAIAIYHLAMMKAIHCDEPAGFFSNKVQEASEIYITFGNKQQVRECGLSHAYRANTC